MYMMMSFNSKFMLPACTTIYTLFLHNNGVALYIGYLDLSIDEMNCLKRYEKLGEGNYIRFIRLEDNLKDKLSMDTGRFTTYAFNRFSIPDYLPEDADRCLWLDADLMIRGDISELYDTDFEDNYFAGARELTSNPLERLGFDDYINSGVLLMNLEKLKEDGMLEKLWEFILDPEFDFPLPDQDALNIVFRGRIKFVDTDRWNRLPMRSDEAAELNPDFERAQKVRIVHFLSKVKPWVEDDAEAWDAAAIKYPVAGMFREEYVDYLVEAMDFLEEHR